MKKRGKILALAAIVVVGAVVLSRCGHKNTAAEYESVPTVKVETGSSGHQPVHGSDRTGRAAVPRERHAEDERRGAGGLLPGGRYGPGRAGAVQDRFRRVDSVKAAGGCGFRCLKECGQQFKPYPGALCRWFCLPGGDGAGTKQRTEREDFL